MVGLKKLLKKYLFERLPCQYRLAAERVYLYYYYGDAYVGRDVRIFKQLCDPCKVSLDIGANWGLMTLFMSKYSHHVYSFEPVPWIYKDLSKKFHGANVSVFDCALGNTDGEFLISIPWIGNRRLETRSSLSKDFIDETILGEQIARVDKVNVKVRRLDDLNITNVGFVKIDVEGFEMEVLEGGAHTIKENMPNMVVEIESRHLRGKNIFQTFKYLADLGYLGYFVYKNRLFEIQEFDGTLMQNTRDEKEKDLYVNNFIFSRLPQMGLQI